jgi:hypothetical protein
MEGLYLYCIREKTAEHATFALKGIEEKGEVFTIIFRDIEAVVSKVSLEEFSSEAIENKTREYLDWIKEKALAHEHIIEEAMNNNGEILSLIPMRFGTIFKEEASLKETLSNDYAKIEEVLERILHKQEWSVKAYLQDKSKFERLIKKQNEMIIEKEREIANLPEGMAFFMEEELKEVISLELEKELNELVEDLFVCLGKYAVDLSKGKILAKELTGKDEPMVLNAAYLISEDKVEDFKNAFARLNQHVQPNGVYLEHSGLWPVYNFTAYKKP